MSGRRFSGIPSSRDLSANEDVNKDASSGRLRAEAMWADDSHHLCGVTYAPGGQAQLVVFDMAGSSRTVTQVGPSG
jgi:hypothetical protein